MRLFIAAGEKKRSGGTTLEIPSGSTLDLTMDRLLHDAVQRATQLVKIFCRTQLLTAESTHKRRNRDGTDDGKERYLAEPEICLGARALL